MKKILFVIDSLTCGGAEKSLVTLLNSFDYSKYCIDLMMFKRGGTFEKFLPSQVKIIDGPHYFEQIQNRTNKNIKDIYYRLKTSFLLRINRLLKENYHSEQVVYYSLRKYLGNNVKGYDCAIAYNQGMPTYYVSNHVVAKKKLTWINCNYVATKYNKKYDSLFYSKIDRVVVVSDFIKSTLKNYPFYRKVKVVTDIVDPRMISQLSARDDEYSNDMEYTGIKLLTVARLEKIKGYDLLVKAAQLLKKSGLNFKWYIIGEGSERSMIESLRREYNLECNVILLGQKDNPYVYMKRCDVYVQTSKNEGLGLTVIEAKILEKIVVCTNFSTASSLISDGKDGILCEVSYQNIAEKILEVLDKPEMQERICKNLEIEEKFDTTGQIKKVYELISLN